MSDLQKFLCVCVQKNTGVYDLLDEESAFPKASDETLATKLHQYLGQYYSLVYHITVPGSVSRPHFFGVHHFTWLAIKTTCVYHCTWVSIKTTFVWCSSPPGSVLRSYLFLWCSSLNLGHYQDHKIFLWCSSLRSVARPYFFGVHVLGQYQDHILWCSSLYLGQYQDHISLVFITTSVSIKTTFLWCSSMYLG